MEIVLNRDGRDGCWDLLSLETQPVFGGKRRYLFGPQLIKKRKVKLETNRSSGKGNNLTANINTFGLSYSSFTFS